MKGSGIYWFLMLIDLMFIGLLRYIFYNYDGNTFWFSLAVIGFARVLTLWVFVFISHNKTFRVNLFEKIVFAGYFLILMGDGIIWSVSTAKFLWPH